MVLRYIDNCIFFIKRSNTSFVIRLLAFKDIWLFNCIEGCQSNVLSKNFKINNLSKIILTDLNINNISGLLGLLSSLNLIGRVKSLHIYGPRELKYYLDLGKKYSHTNFSYTLYLHVLTTGLIINYYSYRVYSFFFNKQYAFILNQSEQKGTFFLRKAKSNYLIPGPLYGKLKKGSIFLLPDGFILNGEELTSSNICGKELCFFISYYYNRNLFENSVLARIILLA
uniref:Ribonuclease Z n=1 Tax=Bostrychia simpliciuscula TaxID=324754 RepID=A0A1Z1M7Y8_9FLOR|nr:ribonuclease Z [Bostrychia simpliciuscula]ARW62003.1 ribonuclease Z [Bostrychia simpliciuscula]